MNVVSHLQRLLMLVLGIVLPGEELAQGEREGRIGDVTLAAIRTFLAEQALTVPEGLEEGSPEMSQWLIQQLEAVQTPGFYVSGQIHDTEHRPVSSVKVQAFDRELPSVERRRGTEPQMLGEVAITDGEGRFRITYTLDQFRAGDAISRSGRTQAQRADISFLIFDQNGQELKIRRTEAPIREVGEDLIIYNAPPRLLDVKLVVDPRVQPGTSEYERLVAAIAPVIEGVPLTELTDEDAAFLVNELELELPREVQQQRIEWLRRSAILAQYTQLPVEAFYGWGRKHVPAAFAELAGVGLADLSSILEKLLSLTDDKLQRTLQEASDEEIIPARFGAGLADVRAYLEVALAKSQRSDEDSPPILPRVSGRLLDAHSGEPLSDYTVHATLRDGPLEGLDLGEAVWGIDGRFDFTHLRLNEARDDGEQGVLIALMVRDPEGRERFKTEVRAEIDGEPAAVWVPRQGDQPPPTPALKDLAADGGPRISRRLSARLSAQGMRTLEDVRKNGGASHLEGLSERDLKTARLLDAHADLFRLSPDVRANAGLITAGYDSSIGIAAARQDKFLGSAHAVLGDAGAAALHAAARAERNVLRSFLTGVRADWASELSVSGPFEKTLAATGPTKCSCQECETAASPLAYLTDLLDYTLDHVQDNSMPVTVDWLTARFHQPFGDLPVACEAMDAMIRQVRLCVEVLRRHLSGQVLPPAASDRLKAGEHAYRLAAYTALLERFGASYEELRLARGAEPKARDVLAERLGFTLDPAQPDRLNALLLDPASLIEADLERLFGLVDTRTSRDPLSDGLVLGDPHLQVTRWDLQRIEWRRTTDGEGLIHLVLRRLAGGVVHVELYRDEARTAQALVAAGERPDATGPVALSARNGSGLSGSLDIHYTADSTTISLAAVPRLLAWRLAELRRIWEEQDRPTTASLQPLPPNIDPDLIGPADLRDPLVGPAADIWRARRKEVDDLLTNLRSTRTAAATAAGALDAALLHPQSLGESAASLTAIEKEEREDGVDIRPKLAALQLSRPAFDLLIRIGRLVSTVPPSTVLESEWAEADAILAQVYKIRRADTWRLEETSPHITLGPDFFVQPEPPPLEFPPPQPAPLPVWLATSKARREWERTLRARCDQQHATVEGHQQGVMAAEEATLIGLRDALIAATGVAGDIPSAAKLLTDRLLIDCANGPCQMTTRIAQAIETIQGLLFSIHTDQLRDTYPKLALAAPDFEREWTWIGSYAPWRAAMLVFMYPENVLHPGLRDRQSPGFKRLVRDARALPAITPEKACQLAKNYSAYFEDVCKLEVEASTRTLTRIYRGAGCRDRSPIQDHKVLHLFARRHDGDRTGHTIYWSTFDADASPDPQSFWDWVPGLEQEHVLEIVGATTYQLPNETRFLYLFVKAFRQGTQVLLFTRYNLQRGAWETGSTALEPPRRGQDFEAMLLLQNESHAPRLTVRHPVGGGPGSVIYRRSLNRDGNGWAEGDWFPQWFSEWQRIGSLTAEPGTKVAVAAPQAERVDIFTVSRGGGAYQVGGVYHSMWSPPFNNGYWGAWERPNSDNNFNVPVGSPVTAFTLAGLAYMELFVVGHTNTLWRRKIWATPGGNNTLAWHELGDSTNNKLPHHTPITVAESQWPETLLVMLDEEGAFIGARPSIGNTFKRWGEFVNGFGVYRFSRPGPVGGVPNFFFAIDWMGRIQWSGGVALNNHDGSMIYDLWERVGDPNLIVPLGSPLSAIMPNDKTRVDVFAVGGDGAINSFWYKFNFPGDSHSSYTSSEKWLRVGGLTVPPRSPIAALARGADHQDLFVVDKDGRVNHAWWDANANDGQWNEWSPISAANETFPIRAPITAVERRPGHMDLFAVGNDGGIYHAWWDQDPNAQWPAEKPYIEVPATAYTYKPTLDGPFELTEQLHEARLQFRRFEILGAYRDNASGPYVLRRNVDYLDEAYYFVPMLLAHLLQRDRHYPSALDWYRTVYDYSMPTADREIAYLLGMNKDWTKAYERAEEWLEDPLNPHRIAATRPRAYARYTIMSLIHCFLEAGDDEYTRDTNESIPRARTYYLTALELEDTPELRRHPGGCEVLVGEVHLELGEGHYERVWNKFRQRLLDLDDRQVIEVAVGQLQELQGAEIEPYARLLQVNQIVQAAEAVVQPSSRMAAVLEVSAFLEVRTHAALLAVPEIDLASRQAARLAGNRVLTGAAAAAGMSINDLHEQRPALAWLDGVRDELRLVPEIQHPAIPVQNENGAGWDFAKETPWYKFDIVSKPDEVYFPAPSHAFCVPPNPVLKTLRLRAELNLYKLRNCRNIAGMERQLDPYTAPTDPGSGMPSLSADGRLIVPGLSGLRPTPYRYSVLVERAKQLAQMAGQFEGSMLAAIEKRDAEAYTILKARHDAELLRSQVRLQDLRVVEAESGVRLAQLQQERTEIELDHWQELLQEDVSSLEQASIDMLYTAIALYAAAAVSSFGAGGTVSLASGFSFGATNLRDAASAYSSLGQVSSTTSQLLGLQASYERRRQDWQYQRRLAQADVGIADQSVTIAQNRLMVNREERLIAGQQADNAAVAVEFLTTKFTNTELYDWMGNVLEGVYRWFLQQAAATAQLAALQLGFERQEVPPPFIQDDYWEAPSDTGSGQAANRRGLTGSARLLQDLYQLDQHAFLKNVRKLHLTKTISLGQMAPVELQRFRQTGVLPFVSTLEMFDRDFPGHYLRLIKSVRTSVIALVPPVQGIRATLTCTGSSRAVVGGGGGPLQTVVVRRDPQLVALSSALNASGVFELDPQPELLMPFEGLGVETQWELRMPRAANPFDFSTIADVLVTFEYTALHSYDHAVQVIRELGRETSFDRPFSFFHELSDAWCDLRSPDQTTTPMKVRFKTTRADFAPNLEDLRIQHVTLFFSFADDEVRTIEVEGLHLLRQGVPPVGGGGSTKDRMITTRRGNPGFSQLIGQEPIGEWELALKDTPEVRSWFAEELIKDILLVITYTGETPAWPA